MDIDKLTETIMASVQPTILHDEGDLNAGDLAIQHKAYESRRLPVRRYELEDLGSLLDYCKRYVDSALGAIFYTTKSIVVLPNEARPFSNRITYAFNRSRRLMAWLDLGRVNQKQFIEFLEIRLGEIDNPGLLEELAKLKLNATISYNSDLDDNNNYRVMFETKQAKGSTDIPKRIKVYVPFFEGEEEDTEFHFRLQFGQPKNDGEKPLFWLEPIGFEEQEAEHVEANIKRLKSELEGYQVFHGTPDIQSVNF